MALESELPVPSECKKPRSMSGALLLSCTRGGNRTRTLLPELDFESSASTNSATRANWEGKSTTNYEIRKERAVNFYLIA